MKPNEAQLEAIAIIRRLLDSWETSNDINSPSHITEIEREFEESDLSLDTCDRMEHRTRQLFTYIQQARTEE